VTLDYVTRVHHASLQVVRSRFCIALVAMHLVDNSEVFVSLLNLIA